MAIVKHNDVDLANNAMSNPPPAPAPHFTFNGTGQLASDYYRSENTADHIDLGLQINHRALGTNYTAAGIDPDGTINFSVNHGSQIGNPARAEWSFNYSVDNLIGGSLEGHNYHLLIDTDPTAGVRYLDLHSVVIPAVPGSNNGNGVVSVDRPAHIVWADSTGTVRIGDDGQNPGALHVTQNSQNLAFFLDDIHAPGPNSGGNNYHYEAGGQFDIKLQEVSLTGVPVQEVHVHVNVI